MRYVGQSYELIIPFTGDFIATFNEAHKLNYGYFYSDKQIEIVNIRVRVLGHIAPIYLTDISDGFGYPLPQANKYIDVFIKDVPEKIPLFIYDQLLPGTIIEGPALIAATDTTVIISPSDVISVDRNQNLSIDVNKV
jgi:N-methylhydantoinase A